MTKITQQFTAYDKPESRDFPFQDYNEFARSENEIEKRPKQKMKIQNQWWTPACTIYAATHILNAMNIIEDKKLWLNRDQIDPASLRTQFCAERWDYSSWSSIQTIANRMKKKWYISWYVTIKNEEDNSIVERQVDSALAMWKFIYTWSAHWDRPAIQKTGEYSERADWKFVGHAWDIVIERKDWDYYRCLNSYWENRWPYWWYFKLHKSFLNKIYSKLLLIDKDDSNMFSRFEEIQKIKQAVALLRQVYNSTTLDSVKNYLEKEQFGKNFSEIYWTVI